MIVKIERLDDFGRGIAYINNKIKIISFKNYFLPLFLSYFSAIFH